MSELYWSKISPGIVFHVDELMIDSSLELHSAFSQFSTIQKYHYGLF